MEPGAYEQIPIRKRIELAIRMKSRFKNQESVAQISEDTGVSRSHIYLLEDKYNEDLTMTDKRRQGRPPKVDDKLKRRIIREIKKTF